MISMHVHNYRHASLLIEACRSVFPDHGIDLHEETLDDMDFHYREVEYPAALVHPIVYGAKSSEYLIMPDGAVSAVGATGDVVLAFRQGLRDIATIVHKPAMKHDTVLAGIVLNEKFGMKPAFIETPQLPADVLDRYDAVLLDADILTTLPGDRFGTLDIVDEWFDLMALPYVQAVFAVQDAVANEAGKTAVAQAAARADAESLARLDAEMAGHISPDEEHAFFGHHRFITDHDTFESLNSYFRLAYYLGLNADIPDVRVYSQDS